MINYNSLQMSYRTFELYPDTVHLDRRLEASRMRVFCCFSIMINFYTKLIHLMS